MLNSLYDIDFKTLVTNNADLLLVDELINWAKDFTRFIDSVLQDKYEKNLACKSHYNFIL